MTLYCGDAGVGEQLAQEALVRAWQRWDQVSTMDAPEAWAFRTAMNLANSWLRRRVAERRANQRTLVAAAIHADDSPRHAGSEGDGPAVRAAVRALPPRQRAVIIARYFQDLTVEETAALLECAPGTVKATTAQAIARLRAGGLLKTLEPEEVR
jgi:RNA polymerase sigma factor (sigma-70 family)